MKLPARSVAWLLPLLLTACFHKSNSTQVQPPLAPPIEDVPPPKPVPSPTDLPPPVVTVPSQTPPPSANASAQPQPVPKPPVKHKKPPAAPAQQASSGSPGVSAIGQLSSGDPNDLKRQTADSIAATERSLNGIGRKLNDQELKTAAQIREYLKQATAALATGDLEGARTLVAKAKVLLGELSQ
jgi:outer membrane biosynthesis protein TonB